MINLTQHEATPDQLRSGVREPSTVIIKNEIKRLLTFNELPDEDLIKKRSLQLSTIAAEEGATSAMIGGAPFLMAPLETALWDIGIVAYYAFTQRIGREKLYDGRVIKTSVFKHLGFVPRVQW